MAVVRITSFTRSKPQIKASVRYIIHRAGREGEKLTRDLFDDAGPSNKTSAYELIDNAPKGTIFFRFVINPDPKREDKFRDLDLAKVTRKTILTLEKQMQKQIRFIATMHDDHSPKRHIHAIVLAQARIDKPMLGELRDSATHEAKRQRKKQDLYLRIQSNRHLLLRSFRRAGDRVERTQKIYGYRGLRFTRSSCSECGGSQTMSRLRGGGYRCQSCNHVREQSRGLNL